VHLSLKRVTERGCTVRSGGAAARFFINPENLAPLAGNPGGAIFVLGWQ